jgi:hypothetical protein
MIYTPCGSISDRVLRNAQKTRPGGKKDDATIYQNVTNRAPNGQESGMDRPLFMARFCSRAARTAAFLGKYRTAPAKAVRASAAI